MIFITQQYVEAAATSATPPPVRVTQQYVEVACPVRAPLNIYIGSTRVSRLYLGGTEITAVR